MMDTRTGEIGTMDSLIENGTPREFIKPINTRNLSRRNCDLFAAGMLDKIGRNHKCPCGSGKRFKTCCMVIAEKPNKEAYAKGKIHPEHIEAK